MTKLSKTGSSKAIQKKQEMPSFSTTRLVGDNVLSGAIGGFITAACSGGSKINLLRACISGAITAGCAISASNNIVKGEYLKAATSATLGVVLISITNKIIKEK